MKMALIVTSVDITSSDILLIQETWWCAFEFSDDLIRGATSKFSHEDFAFFTMLQSSRNSHMRMLPHGTGMKASWSKLRKLQPGIHNISLCHNRAFSSITTFTVFKRHKNISSSLHHLFLLEII